MQNCLWCCWRSPAVWPKPSWCRWENFECEIWDFVALECCECWHGGLPGGWRLIHCFHCLPKLGSSLCCVRFSVLGAWGVAFKCESHRQLNVFLLFKGREITKWQNVISRLLLSFLIKLASNFWSVPSVKLHSIWNGNLLDLFYISNFHRCRVVFVCLCNGNVCCLDYGFKEADTNQVWSVLSLSRRVRGPGVRGGWHETGAGVRPQTWDCEKTD